MSSHVLHSEFEIAASHERGTPSVWSDGRIWYCSEINNHANLLAILLATTGVTRGDNVGVFLPRSVHHLIATLAILKCGAAVAPLDVNYPVQRTSAMIKHAGLTVIITASANECPWHSLESEEDKVTLERSVTLWPLTTMHLDYDVVKLVRRYPNPTLPIDPESVAYVMFTSGTTGFSRAVRLSHAQVSLYAETYAEILSLGARDHVYALFASFSFVAHYKQLWAPLLSGNRVVIVSETVRRNPIAFAQLVLDHEVTAFDVVPGFLHSLVNEWKLGTLPVGWDRSLRAVGTSGDILSWGLVKKLARLAQNNIDFYNLYGMTESCGIVVTHHLQLTRDKGGFENQRHPLVPVGRAMRGAELHLLKVSETDGSYEVAEAESPASEDAGCLEIFITGPRVGRGYLAQTNNIHEWPTLQEGLKNGAAFMFDSITPGSPPQRILRTFDVGLREADGSVVQIGRRGDLIKVLGVRLSPSEISGHIEQSPSIREAAVFHHSATSKLIAFVVPVDDQHVILPSSPVPYKQADIEVLFGSLARPLVRSLNKKLSEVLPSAALPNHYIAITAGLERGGVKACRIPRSVQQKIDRMQLAEWADHCVSPTVLAPTPQQRSATDASSNINKSNINHRHLLKKLTNVVREVIAIGEGEVLDEETDFLSLGMTSLAAAEIAHRAGEIFGSVISASLIYQHPSVIELANALSAITGSDTANARTSTSLDGPMSPGTSIPRRERRPGLDSKAAPLSFAQESIWVHHQSLMDSSNDKQRKQAAMLNVCRTFVLDGVLDLEALEQALRFLVERHEILRTNFGFYGPNKAQPAQIISPHRPPFEFEYNPSLIATSTTGSALQSELKRLSETVFDLASGPLLKAAVLPLDSSLERNILCVVIHHIITDGWSTGCLLTELADAYRKISNGESDAQLWASHPRPPVHYADFAVLQRSDAFLQLLRKDAQYWANQLETHETLNLPTDFPRGPTTTSRGSSYNFTIRWQLLEAIKSITRENRVSIFSFLMSSFMILLSRYSGQVNICTGTYSANRGITPAENMLGCFINAIPYVHKVDPDLKFGQLLREINDKSLSALDHQHVPFEMMLEASKAETRDFGEHPIFQTALVLQNQRTRSAFALQGTSARELQPHISYAKLDLCAVLEERLAETLDLASVGQLSVSPTSHTFGSPHLEVRIEYNADLFHRQTVANIAESWLYIMEAAAHDSLASVADIPHLPPAHFERSIHLFNRIICTSNATRHFDERTESAC